jgi:general stress protein YciG
MEKKRGEAMATGGLTVREAGQMGGKATSRKHNHDFYVECGRKGGKSTKARHGSEYYRALGRKGGAELARLIAIARDVEGEWEDAGNTDMPFGVDDGLPVSDMVYGHGAGARKVATSSAKA